MRPFFRVVSTEEARTAIRRFRPVAGDEGVDLEEASGRVLARAVRAPEDLPHFDRANMDGYAVRAADTFGASASAPAYLRLRGTIEMGVRPQGRLGPGEAMRIATGGMMPPGADAVVMVEYTREAGDTVEVHRAVAPGQDVLHRGEDVARGTPLFPAGHRLRPRDLAVLAALGIARVRCRRLPVVALLSTGDELVAPQVRPAPGQIRDANQPALAALVRAAGCRARILPRTGDDPGQLRAALEGGLKTADALLLSGGSSVGTKDLTTEVIASLPEARIVFHGIAVAPGKPTVLARVGKRPLLGLPGHPVSALVIFTLFGEPLLRILAGEDPAQVFRPRRTVRARLASNVASRPGREDHVRVGIVERDGHLVAEPLHGKSGAILHLVQASGLLAIPASCEGLEAGAEVEVRIL